MAMWVLGAIGRNPMDWRVEGGGMGFFKGLGSEPGEGCSRVSSKVMNRVLRKSGIKNKKLDLDRRASSKPCSGQLDSQVSSKV